MAIVDLFSKRQKRLKGEVAEVYTYDEIPSHLRVQIVQMWLIALGQSGDFRHIGQSTAYIYIVDTLCSEYGYFALSSPQPGGVLRNREYIQELVEFFMSVKDTEKAIDAIELSFQVINAYTRRFDYLRRRDADSIANDVITQLNSRFKEHAIGYQFLDNRIVRFDSELIHSEVVVPSLRLLNQPGFSGVQDEFLQAHSHHRQANNKEALVECLKAFESMMKAICNKRQWAYDPKSTAKDLINLCLQKELVPSFWQSSLGALRTLLESSVPTGRNKLGGHGQGSEPVGVPDYLVAYMLHMTAACIVFLGDADAAYSPS